MPIYEYKCKKCGEKFELKLGFFHTKNAIKCPVCGSNDAERIFSPFLTDTSRDSGCGTTSFGGFG